MTDKAIPKFDPAAISLADQVAAVNREIGMRERVYPTWVEKGRMTERKAAQEIAAMKAVAATLAKIAAGSLLL